MAIDLDYGADRVARYLRVKQQLESERSSFMSHWRELNDYFLPRRGRFSTSDVNRGDKRNKNIIDSTGTFAARTLMSGMMSGITSPARPWMRLTTPDPELAEFEAVKIWLSTVTSRMLTIFSRSPLYNSLPTLYGDMGVFATGTMGVFEDEHKVIRTKVFPLGSFCIANDENDEVRVFQRSFRMSARQVVHKFGIVPGSRNIDWSRISLSTKRMFESGQRDQPVIEIVHTIEPNEYFDRTMLAGKFKQFASCYLEIGSERGKLLEESGYDEFPILAPRWDTTGEDAYGTMCPGMMCLGDVKQLQTMEKTGAKGLQKMVDPPMSGPTSLRSAKPSILPAAVTYYDVREGMQGFKPAHEVQLALGELSQEKQTIRNRIERGFFSDLFLMLSYSDPTRGQQPLTATEVQERHEEKLLALGPVLEQLNQDLLDPLVDRTFAIMLRRGFIPPPPRELHDVPLRVEYLSILQQAQKSVSLGGIEKVRDFIMPIAEANPAVWDKIDTDAMVNAYADAAGADPRIIVPDDRVAAIRKARGQQAQAAQAAATIKDAAQGAQSLSQAQTAPGSNALADLLGQQPGQQAGQPVGGIS